MRKLKVMHLILSMETGGTQTRIAYLANMLNKEQFDFSICCFERVGNTNYNIDAGVKIFLMHKKPGIAFLLPFSLAGLFRREKIDIVHTHGFNTLFYGLIGALLAGVRVKIHGEQGDIFEQTKQKRLLYVRSIFSRFIDCVVVNSFGLKETVKALTGIADSKFKVIYNGIDTEKFKPPVSISGRNNNEVMVGTVGRLVECKNQQIIVRAMAQVKAKAANVKALIIGDGPLRKELEGLAKTLQLEGCVRFAGNRSDIPQLLNSLDIFILPSFAEGCSNALLEAMSCGLPVLASDTVGNSELVKDNVTGMLFRLEDADSLAEGILALAGDKNKREEMGRQARKRAEEFFSLERMVNEYSGLYLSESAEKIK